MLKGFVSGLVLAGVATSVSAAPDLDGDGVPETLVAPSALARDEVVPVRVVSGASGAVLHELADSGAEWAFGYAAIWSPDLDGDGKEDLAVAAPLAANEWGLGQVYVFSSQTGLVISVLAPAQTGQFGLALERVDDANGDGVAELGVWSRVPVAATGDSVDLLWTFESTPVLVLELPSEGQILTRTRSDVDRSGLVDLDDVVLVAMQVGSTVSTGSRVGDIDLSGQVDSVDVGLVADRLGSVVGVAATGQSYVGWDAASGMYAKLKREPDRMPERCVSLACLGMPSLRAPGWGGGSGSGGGEAGNTGGTGGSGGSSGSGTAQPPRGTTVVPKPLRGPTGGTTSSGGDPPSCAYLVSVPYNQYVCMANDGESGCTTSVIVPVSSSSPHAQTQRRWTISGGEFVTANGLASTFVGATATIRRCTPGRSTVTVGLANGSCSSPVVMTFDFYRADIDIDSDNTGQFEGPARNAGEERVEAQWGVEEHPGKVIAVGNFDVDGDGIPDYWDGFDVLDAVTPDDNSSTHQSPTIKASVDGGLSDQAVVVFTYPRAWTPTALSLVWDDMLD